MSSMIKCITILSKLNRKLIVIVAGMLSFGKQYIMGKNAKATMKPESQVYWTWLILISERMV